MREEMNKEPVNEKARGVGVCKGNKGDKNGVRMWSNPHEISCIYM